MIKRLLLCLFCVALLMGAARKSSNKIDRYLKEEGMVLIQGGTFLMGQSDPDSTTSIFSQLADEVKQVSITSFYMDQSEVTNKEYREFVNWVKDSIAVSVYLQNNAYFIPGATTSDRLIDWPKVKKDRKSWWAFKDESLKEQLQGMFYQGEDRIFGRDELNVSLLKYNYEYFDLKAAAENRDKNLPRSAFIVRDTVSIYPDTLSWISDFQYADNQAMAQSYFSNPAYDDYPVVGVTWRQANAFNNWRTRMLEKKLSDRKGNLHLNLMFQLPTDAQWEYAARGGELNTRYPWGNEITCEEGCMQANFKTEYGNYMNGNANIMVSAFAYEPNKFGLYNMAGNVAEWTSSSFDESANIFVHDLNPNYSFNAKDTDPNALQRKVVRGGSWKDSEYFLRNSTRTFEYQNSPKSYIGFRSVIVVPGEQSKEPDNLFYYFINGYGYIKKSNIGLDSFINWGATIVIIGLMFKLQHWQWGDWMIVIGLGAEAIIFLILGYQAIGNSEEQETKPSVAAVQTGHAASLDDMLSQSDISPQDIQNLGKGLSRFSTTVESLSEMATTTIQVNEFTEKLQTVSSSFDRFSSAFEKASRDLESFGVSTVDTVAYQEQINRLSKNLEALNGIYEKELSQANSSFVSMSAHYDRIAETLTNLNDSAAETKVFKDQVDLLNKNLASLNAVYGNMLAAMSQPRVN